MIQQTKQQLRDEIVTLTMRNKTLEINQKAVANNLTHSLRSGNDNFEKALRYKTEAKRATIAAYALLVTLFVIVGVGVIW